MTSPKDGKEGDGGLPERTMDQCGDAGLRTRAAPERGSLIHYGAKPIKRLIGTRQVPDGGDVYRKFDKPKGLWVSVLGRDDWANWCRAESFRKTRIQAATMVVLRPDAKVLRLTSAAEIDVFSRDYGEPHDWSGGKYPAEQVIQWDRVAADWHGIIIAPYVWERRLHNKTGWYYGWDCASGCIWSPRAVEGLHALRESADARAHSSPLLNAEADPGETP